MAQIVSTAQIPLSLSRHVSTRHVQACSARRDECVEPVELVVSRCSTSSTRPKCTGSTRRTCRVVSKRDATWRVEWNLGLISVAVDSACLSAVALLFDVRAASMNKWPNGSCDDDVAPVTHSLWWCWRRPAHRWCRGHRSRPSLSPSYRASVRAQLIID